MIGNMASALKALRMPEAFKTMTGSSRHAVLINNVIYKVDLYAYEGYNDLEYANYQRLCIEGTPDPIRIPEMTRYVIGDEIVLACQYIKGKPVGECSAEYAGLPCDCYGPCLSSDFCKQIDRLGINDTSYGNVILRNGFYYLVDMGEGSLDR